MNNNLQENTLLKKLTVQIPQNTRIGKHNLITVRPTDIRLPAGTVLQSGNVRIPLLINAENNEPNLDKIENDDTATEGTAGTAGNNANQNNISYYHDENNNLYSTIPSKLDQLYNEEKAYCEVTEGTLVKFNDNNQLKFSIQQNEWMCLYRGTIVKIPADTLLEFRINGSWFKIKTFKIEKFKL